MNKRFRSLNSFRQLRDRDHQRLEANYIPRTLSVRGFLHFLSRKKDRGASKS